MYKGIDVSKWQSNIDWQKVKNAGINFAILRATAAKGTDAWFERNYAGAKAAGMNVGAYHYSYALNVDEARKEAEYFLSVVKGKKFEYPLVFDLEDTSQANLGKDICTGMVNAFAEIVETAGYYCMLYANKDWLQNRLHMNRLRTDIWLSQWNYTEIKPTWTDRFGIWQNSNKGRVDGINGDVDTNISYRDYPAIIRERCLNGFGAAPEPSVDWKAKYDRLAAAVKTLPVE